MGYTNENDKSPLEQMEVGDLVNLNVGPDGERYEVMAVPGGWIYTRFAKVQDREDDKMSWRWKTSSVFVPKPHVPQVVQIGKPEIKPVD